LKVDRDVVFNRFDTIERNLQFLEEYRGHSVEEFLDSYKDVQAAKFSLLEIIEACIDVANHIISVKGFRRAEEYSVMFKVLGEMDVIDVGLAGRLGDMARFRNLLVHRYGEVDDARVLGVVQHSLVDVELFMSMIAGYLESE